MCYGRTNTQVNLKQPLRLKNHQKDLSKQDLLQVDRHFCLRGHNFNK